MKTNPVLSLLFMLAAHVWAVLVVAAITLGLLWIVQALWSLF